MVNSRKLSKNYFIHMEIDMHDLQWPDILLIMGACLSRKGMLLQQMKTEKVIFPYLSVFIKTV
jgi:hypothetical protein